MRKQSQKGVLTANSARTEEYCEVMVVGRLVQPRTTAHVDFGQRQAGIFPEAYEDANGQPLRFDSPIAALNYLNTQGWELLQVYVAGTNADTAHYVMRWLTN